MTPRLARSSLIAMAFATVASIGLAGPTQAQLAVGATAPGFTLTDTQGVPRSLSDYAGEVVVLYFVGYG